MAFFEYFIILLFSIVAIFVSLVMIFSSTFPAIFASSLLSLFVMIIYLVISAPDVAITEAAVGSAVSTIFLLIAMKGINHYAGDDGVIKVDKVSRIKTNLLNGSVLKSPYLMIILIISIFCGIADAFINVSIIEGSEHMKSSAYYITQSYKETGVKNIVTSVLGGYRGFDTMIESLVVLIAALGVMYILKSDPKTDQMESSVNKGDL